MIANTHEFSHHRLGTDLDQLCGREYAAAADEHVRTKNQPGARPCRAQRGPGSDLSTGTDLDLGTIQRRAPDAWAELHTRPDRNALAKALASRSRTRDEPASDLDHSPELTRQRRHGDAHSIRPLRTHLGLSGAKISSLECPHPVRCRDMLDRIRSRARESPLYRPYVRWKYRLSPDARRKYFAGMYERNVWGDEHSRSGSGSNLENTAVLRDQLPGFLDGLGIRSLLDLPCGDWAWMRHVDLSALEHYIGADVVPELIDQLRDEYGGAGREFVTLDALTDELPRVDAIMVRDLFGHLDHIQMRRLVRNAKRSGSTWLLASHYPGLEHNEDVRMGSWRPQNFTLAPYDWPAPAAMLAERPQSAIEREDKMLAAWRLELL